MTDLQVYEVPRKRGYWMVEFLLQDGLGTAYRFSDFTSDVMDQAGETYSSVPSMSIELPASTGLLSASPAVLELPVSAHAFFDRVSKGEPHVPVLVVIREAFLTYSGDPLGPYAFEAVHYSGRLTKTLRSPNGRDNSIRFEVVSAKGRLGVRQGVPATAQCRWIFRQAPCGAESAAAADTQTSVEIMAIDGTVVTTDGLGFPPTTAGDIYRRGSLFNPTDGLELEIRIWELATPTRVVLTRPPPADWLGALVDMRPGCVRTAEACDAWGQTENFGGVLLKALNYHPVYEVPGA